MRIVRLRDSGKAWISVARWRSAAPRTPSVGVMNSEVEHQREHPSFVEAARLRTGLRWLVGGSIVALMGLISWSILAAANGSAAGTVAASSGSVAVVIAWTTGYSAMSARLRQLASQDSDGSAGPTATS